MKQVVLVTSTIQPDYAALMDNGSIRTAFTASERLIQTFATVHSIQSQLPAAEIVICDASQPNYGFEFGRAFPAVHFVHVESYEPDIAQAIRTRGNKSWGECQLLLACWHVCRDLIEDADFVLKFSGRYMAENLQSFLRLPLTPDCYVFGQEHPSDVRPWIDAYGIDWSLAKSIKYPTQQRHVLHTVLYGWGKSQTLMHFERIKTILLDLHRPEYKFYDIENLLSRELAGQPILRTTWRYIGWNGVTGDFVRF